MGIGWPCRCTAIILPVHIPIHTSIIVDHEQLPIAELAGIYSSFDKYPKKIDLMGLRLLLYRHIPGNTAWSCIYGCMK